MARFAVFIITFFLALDFKSIQCFLNPDVIWMVTSNVDDFVRENVILFEPFDEVMPNSSDSSVYFRATKKFGNRNDSKSLYISITDSITNDEHQCMLINVNIPETESAITYVEINTIQVIKYVEGDRFDFRIRTKNVNESVH